MNQKYKLLFLLTTFCLQPSLAFGPTYDEIIISDYSRVTGSSMINNPQTHTVKIPSPSSNKDFLIIKGYDGLQLAQDKAVTSTFANNFDSKDPSIVVVDINNDGIKEYITSSDSDLLVYQLDGTIMQKTTHSGTIHGLYLHSNSQGKQEIIVTPASWRKNKPTISIYDYMTNSITEEITIEPTWDIASDFGSISKAAHADINNDGIKDLVFLMRAETQNKTFLVAINLATKSIFEGFENLSVDDDLDLYPTPPVISTWEGKNSAILVLSTKQKSLLVFNSQGTNIASHSLETSNDMNLKVDYSDNLIVGDLDKNNKTDIVFCLYSSERNKTFFSPRLYALEVTQESLTSNNNIIENKVGWPITYTPENIFLGPSLGEPLAADIDNDNIEEIVITGVLNYEFGQDAIMVSAFELDGSEKTDFRLFSQNGDYSVITPSATIGNFDNDAFNELAVGADVFDLTMLSSSSTTWSSFGGKNQEFTSSNSNGSDSEANLKLADLTLAVNFESLSTIAAGDTITLDLTANNQSGNATANDVIITLPIKKEFKYTSEDSDCIVSNKNNTLICSFDSLSVGESKTKKVALTFKNNKLLKSRLIDFSLGTISISSNANDNDITIDSDSTNNSTTIEFGNVTELALMNLAITATADKISYQNGDTANIVVKVNNLGKANAVLADSFATSFSFAIPNGLSLVGPLSNICSQESGTIRCNLASVQSDSSKRQVFKFKIASGKDISLGPITTTNNPKNLKQMSRDVDLSNNSTSLNIKIKN